MNHPKAQQEHEPAADLRAASDADELRAARAPMKRLGVHYTRGRRTLFGLMTSEDGVLLVVTTEDAIGSATAPLWDKRQVRLRMSDLAALTTAIQKARRFAADEAALPPGVPRGSVVP